MSTSKNDMIAYSGLLSSMVKRAMACMALGAIIFVNAFSGAMAQTNQNQIQQAVSDIDWMMEEFQKASGVPGMSMALGMGDTILIANGYGVSNYESKTPVSATTVFRLTDTSTLFTATAIMKLAAEGRIDLDADIRTYVPSFPKKRYSVSIRQILSHTAGITHFDYNDYNRGQKTSDTLSDALKQFSVRPLKARPGTVHKFSAYGYVLLGLAIEKVTGQSYEDYIKKNLFDPLLILDGHFDHMRELPPSQTLFYNRMPDSASLSAKRDYSFVKPAAGINSTPSSVVKLLAAYWNGTALDPTQWVNMLSAAPYIKTAEQKRFYEPAIGWRLSRDHDGDLFYHMSGKTVGAVAAYMSNPRHGLHIAFTGNARVEAHPRQTNLALLAPLKAVVKSQDRSQYECPVGLYAYRGRYNNEFTKGSMAIQFENNRCYGTIDTPPKLTSYFIAQGSPMPKALKMIYLSNTDKAAKFAIITPLGIFTVDFSLRENGIKGDMIIDGRDKWTISAIKS